MLECKLRQYRVGRVPDRELIDTCWNVNQNFRYHRWSIPHRINRYMLECKSCCNCTRNTCGSRINRYMLECKSWQGIMTRIQLTELIDTCWNVNSILMDSWECGAVELIDTCWNVNKDISASAGSEYNELIDTCWNVNLHEWSRITLPHVN